MQDVARNFRHVFYAAHTVNAMRGRRCSCAGSQRAHNVLCTVCSDIHVSHVVVRLLRNSLLSQQHAVYMLLVEHALGSRTATVPASAF
jgi:hypothetical protein